MEDWLRGGLQVQDGGGFSDDGRDAQGMGWALRFRLQLEREGADDDGRHQQKGAEGDGVADLCGGTGCCLIDEREGDGDGHALPAEVQEGPSEGDDLFAGQPSCWAHHSTLLRRRAYQTGQWLFGYVLFFD